MRFKTYVCCSVQAQGVLLAFAPPAGETDVLLFAVEEASLAWLPSISDSLHVPQLLACMHCNIFHVGTENKQYLCLHARSGRASPASRRAVENIALQIGQYKYDVRKHYSALDVSRLDLACSVARSNACCATTFSERGCM